MGGTIKVTIDERNRHEKYKAGACGIYVINNKLIDALSLLIAELYEKRRKLSELAPDMLSEKAIAAKAELLEFLGPL